MNTNIALAQQLAKERQHEITQAAEQWRRVREALPARESWIKRLLHHGSPKMSGATCKVA